MTQEQISIAKEYELRAFAAMHDEEEFQKIMTEFEEIKKSWRVK